MRTIRDNYYIVTGHTYEEYLKKYHHAIGKGKLLSFTEDEVKFLKKNKLYWEVIGPDGKTLYCQVKKLKPKHVIVPLSIVAVIGLGVGAGILIPKLIGFNGEVTKDEWKQSFSYITEMGLPVSNEYHELNYKANGKVYVGYNHETLYGEDNTELIVVKNPFGEYETLKIYNTESHQYQDYSFRRYKNLPLLKNPLGEISSTTSLIHDTFDIALDSIYKHQDGFSFNKKNKSYNFSSEEIATEELFKELFCEIKYNQDKKIQHLNLRYLLSKPESVDGCEGAYVDFDLEFTYGDQQIALWDDTESARVYQNYAINVKDSDIKTISGDKYAIVGSDKQFNRKQSFLVNLDLQELTELPLKEYIFELYDKSPERKINWTDFIEVYYNDERVKRVAGYSEEEPISYYFHVENKDIYGVELNFIPKANSKITLKFGVRFFGIDPQTGDYSIYVH